MTDKQVVMKLLKIRKSNPKVHLELSYCIDEDSKYYDKKYLVMMLPISRNTYNKLNRKNSNPVHTYQNK